MKAFGGLRNERLYWGGGGGDRRQRLWSAEFFHLPKRRRAAESRPAVALGRVEKLSSSHLFIFLLCISAVQQVHTGEWRWEVGGGECDSGGGGEQTLLRVTSIIGRRRRRWRRDSLCEREPASRAAGRKEPASKNEGRGYGVLMNAGAAECRRLAANAPPKGKNKQKKTDGWSSGGGDGRGRHVLQ